MESYIAQTREWVSKWVIGLDLCPFAARPFRENLIRYVVEEGDDPQVILERLMQEMLFLSEKSPTEVQTTLLIFPNGLNNFLAYNDFLGEVEELIDRSDLRGIFQVASFHPDYQFADADQNDPSNYTNRSPFPMLHLLRESSVEQAVAFHPNTELIPEENIKKLRVLGMEGINRLIINQVD